MRSILLLLALYAAALAAPLPPPKPPGKADLKALQGEWEATNSRAGTALRAGAGGLTITVKEDRLSFLVDGEMRTTWVVTLDPKKAPKAIDLRRVASRSGAVGELTLRAVYHVEGDSFTLAYGNDRRPTDLEGKKAGEWVYVCKRRK
jgi:uncharacterized protein (TIGR03067 family)